MQSPPKHSTPKDPPNVYVSVSDALTAPERFDEYHGLYRIMFQANPHMFYRMNLADLKSENARIATVHDKDTGELLSAARGIIDDENRLVIGQACTAIKARGQNLMGLAIDHLRLACFTNPPAGHAPVKEAILQVRILRDKVNQSAIRAYEKVDFRSTEIVRMKVAGKYRDQHLGMSLDPDGLYSSQQMVADVASLMNCWLRVFDFNQKSLT